MSACQAKGSSDGLETLEQVVETGVDGIKLHPLHIVTGSIMAKAWEAGRLNGIELDDYTVTAGEMIRHTPPEIDLPPHLRQRPPPNAAGTALV